MWKDVKQKIIIDSVPQDLYQSLALLLDHFMLSVGFQHQQRIGHLKRRKKLWQH